MDPIDRVKNMVRHALVASPSVTNKELFDRAKEIAPAAVEGMSLKQFHAKFRLPISRFEIGRKGPKKEKVERVPRATVASEPVTRTKRIVAGVSNSARGQVRDIVIEFAVDLERAEQRADLVQAVSRIDQVVDQIMEIAQRHIAATRNGSVQPAADRAEVLARPPEPATPPAPARPDTEANGPRPFPERRTFPFVRAP
jgi:hypothetical protein